MCSKARSKWWLSLLYNSGKVRHNAKNKFWGDWSNVQKYRYRKTISPKGCRIWSRFEVWFSMYIQYELSRRSCWSRNWKWSLSDWNGRNWVTQFRSKMVHRIRLCYRGHRKSSKASRKSNFLWCPCSCATRGTQLFCWKLHSFRTWVTKTSSILDGWP